jgi:hypothetical protein
VHCAQPSYCAMVHVGPGGCRRAQHARRWQKGFAHACVQRQVRGAGLLLRERSSCRKRHLALEHGRGRVRVDIYYGLQGLRLLECSDAQPPRHRADKAAATPRHRNAASVRIKLARAQTTTCAREGHEGRATSTRQHCRRESMYTPFALNADSMSRDTPSTE